jgi:hypothetical protein
MEITIKSYHFNFDSQQSKKQKDRECDSCAYALHIASNNIKIFEQIIEMYTLDVLFETRHNGIISKLLEYFIHINDNVRIVCLLETVEMILMKRDYLHLIKYYYESSLELALDIFQNKVLSKFKTEILSKDIDYIMEHKMVRLIPFMEGLFIKTSFNDTIISIEEVERSKPTMYTIPTDQIEMILSEVQKESGTTFNMKQKFAAIIDGGSVIHSRGGHISKLSLDDLINISQIVRTTLGEPIIVIHKRHQKTIPNLEKELHKNGISYFLSPHKMNDDIFILNLFMSLGTKPYIITNDKYRDHIFQFEKSKGIKFGLSQFKDMIEQQTISFDITRNWLNFKSDVSMCIQKYKDSYIIPHMDGNFIYINL